MIDRIQKIDDKILDNITRLYNPPLNAVMKFFTRLGNLGIVWFLIIIPLFIFVKTRVAAINMVIGISITHIMGEILIKHIVCRERPCHKLEDDEQIINRPKYYSFPSGHTAASFSIVAIAMFRCSPAYWIPILVLASIISFSRIYLRVHYLSDVLVGMFLGFICGSASVSFTNYIFFKLAIKFSKDNTLPVNPGDTILKLDSAQITAVLVVYAIIVAIGLGLILYFKKKNK